MNYLNGANSKVDITKTNNKYKKLSKIK